MPTEPTIYTIVPGYNVETYLDSLAQSLSHQTYSGNKVVIFIDDGSEDKTLKKMNELSIEGFSKHVVSNSHEGVSAARNTGLDWIKQSYSTDGVVLFLDADDMFTNEAFELIAQQFMNNNLDILAFGSQPLYESEQLKKEKPAYLSFYKRKGSYPAVMSGQEYLHAVLPNGDFRPSVRHQAFSLSFLKSAQLRFCNGIIHEDNLFSFEALLHASKVKFIANEIYIRRVRPNSIMTKTASTANLDGYFKCALNALGYLSESTVVVRRSDDCASVIDMWLSSASDYYSALDASEISELLALYAPEEQILFYELVEQRARYTRNRESELQAARNAAYHDAENVTKAKFESSISFKIGRAITAIPRALLRR